MSLLEDLRTVAANSLNGSDLPTHVEVQDLLGAVIKTLDKAGIAVADDLLPKPAAEVADTVITAAEPVEQGLLDKALAEVDRLKAELEQHRGGATPEGFKAPDTSSSAPAGPVVPPIEGAS